MKNCDTSQPNAGGAAGSTGAYLSSAAGTLCAIAHRLDNRGVLDAVTESMLRQVLDAEQRRVEGTARLLEDIHGMATPSPRCTCGPGSDLYLARGMHIRRCPAGAL